MQLTHTLLQEKNKLNQVMSTLWSKREKGETWTDSDRETYEKSAAEVEKVNKDLQHRIAFEQHLQDSKDVETKKFERSTKSLGIGNILRALMFQKTNDSTFKDKDSDIGKLREWESKAIDEECGGVSKKDYGAFAIPSQALNTPAETQAYTRALTTAANSAGDALVDQVKLPFVTTLFEKTILKRAGCEVQTVGRGIETLKYVKFEDTNRSEAKAETDALGVKEVSYDDEATASSHKIGRLIEVSNLVLSRLPDGDSSIRNSMVREFSSTVDKFMLTGTGSNNQIRGILNDPDLFKIEASANGDALTLAKFVNAERDVENKLNMDELVYLVNPNIKAKLRSTLRFAVNGSLPLWDDMTNSICGKRAFVSTLLPSNKTKGSGRNLSEAMLLSPVNCKIVQFSLPSISVSTEGSTWFSKDFSCFRVVAYLDVCLIRPDTSHALLKDLITA